MGTRFDYDILTATTEPPSDYQYVARVGSILRHSGNASEIVPWSEHQIPEMWGMTEDEAYTKLENLIKEWIATQEQ